MTDRWLEPTHEDFDKIRREKHPDLYAEYNQKCSLAELETLNQQMREAPTQKSQKRAQEFVESKEEKERIAQYIKDYPLKHPVQTATHDIKHHWRKFRNYEDDPQNGDNIIIADCYGRHHIVEDYRKDNMHEPDLPGERVYYMRTYVGKIEGPYAWITFEPYY